MKISIQVDVDIPDDVENRTYIQPEAISDYISVTCRRDISNLKLKMLKEAMALMTGEADADIPGRG